MLKFEPGIIASIQPRLGSAFRDSASVARFAIECAKYAVALRIEGIENIKEVAKSVSIPIIGLLKYRVDELNTYITPTLNDARAVKEAGSTYVAMEYSTRFESAVQRAVDAKIEVIADIGDFISASKAEDCGATALTTALAGYLNNKPVSPFDQPCLSLVEVCAEMFDIPIIAEGRYWADDSVTKARKFGAHSVCIGTAFSDPAAITERAKVYFCRQYHRTW